MTHRISVVCSALALAVLSCSLQPPSSSAEEGFVLSTASSPAISIGFEKGRLGIYAGAGFRWRKNTYSYSGDVVITERDTSESVAVVIPALTLRYLGRSETLPWYLAVGVERDVPVYTSATGYDEGNFPFGNSEVEDRLDSENRQTFIDGGLGVRAPLTDRLFLGGEFGVYYAFSKSDLESDMYRSSSETKYMGTYLRVLAFFYP
jgi:hypothetical protein